MAKVKSLEEVFNELQNVGVAAVPDIGSGHSSPAVEEITDKTKKEVGLGTPDGVAVNEVDGNDEGHASDGSSKSPKGKELPSDSQKTDSKDVEPEDGDDQELKSWDELIPDDVPTQQPKVLDWDNLSEVIGLEQKIKGPDDLKNYIQTIKQELQTLKNSPTVENLPGDLKEAIEVAKRGGDYYTYLGITQVDYKQIPPEELFEEEVAQLFYNDKGEFDETGYNEYLDSIPEPEKKLRGLQIQKELIRLQNEAKKSYMAKLEEQRNRSVRQLEKELQNFNKVGDFEVTPKIKNQLYKVMSDGGFMNEFGISSDGNHNWGKLLDVYFKYKYFDTIQKYVAQRARTEKTRKDLEKLTNPQLTGKTTRQNPVEHQPSSGVDLYMEQLLKQLQQQTNK